MKNLIRNVMISVSLAAIVFETVQVQAAGNNSTAQQDAMNLGIIPLDGGG